jgi:myo-inositol 2-dehydrogenase/D-chiro-inositol 1-dehydrogenase
MTNKNEASRRDFLKTSAAAAGVLAGGLVLQNTAHAAGDDKIKVGIIGCGGRGKGAAHNVLVSAPGVEIIALADAFEDRLNNLHGEITKICKEDGKIEKLGNKFNVPKDRQFVGLDAYEKLLKTDVNYVILATPPGFRPTHLEAAVAAKKNIFTEKPVSTDAPGIRKVLDAADAAKTANLAIVAGTQRRHQKTYQETMKRIKDGEIGELVGGRFYWNQGLLWKVDRTSEMSDLEYQMRNWYNFTWLCGDHIVEQHVHNIDVMCWAFGAHPVAAVSMGGRSRTNPAFGHIYDFFAVDFEMPKRNQKDEAPHTLSMCRQISGCATENGEHLVGTQGTCHTADRYTFVINGKPLWEKAEMEKNQDPYVQEHTDLIASIRAGKPLNELRQVAESTLTAIMGRMSAYTGKRVTWDMALNSKEELFPSKLDWHMKLDTPAVAVPGTTKFV